MKIVTRLAAVVLLFPVSILPQTPHSSDAAAPVFRAPFTLTIQNGKETYTEQFEKIAYVADNDVSIFAGEHFGINFTMADDKISQVTYQPDLSKADVTFKFEQQKGMMMLTIKNNVKRQLLLDALMTVPEKKDFYRTSIIPIEPGLSSSEVWPHAIVQLVLRNFRLAAKPVK
jgi:hypothetical protein